MTNKTPLILVLSFVTLAIVGSLYLFVQKGAMNAPFNVGQNQQQPTQTIQTPPTIPTPEIPKDWKTYENEEMKFAFDYPGDWKINFKDAYLSNSFLVLLRSDTSQNAIDLRDIQVKIKDIKSDTLENYFKNQQVLGAIKNYHKIPFKHYNAYEVIYGGYGLSYAIDIQRDNRIYEFFIEETSSGSGLSLKVKAIIQSFRFF